MSPYRLPFERFWSKVLFDDGCWRWTASTNGRGYGRFNAYPNGNQAAHRISYETLVGPIPEGKILDHLCHNRDESCPGGKLCRHRLCVNPSHLEPVAGQENIDRAVDRRPQTHCKHGHEATPENTRMRIRGEGLRDTRVCKVCKREQAKALRKERKI